MVIMKKKKLMGFDFDRCSRRFNSLIAVFGSGDLYDRIYGEAFKHAFEIVKESFVDASELDGTSLGVDAKFYD